MRRNLIEIEHVTKIFRKTDKVLDDINLNIREGEFITLLGPSGCGKSTLLRLIAGLEELTEGDIYIDDKDTKKIPANERNINMVFQSYALFPHMTVYDNIAFGLQCKFIPKHDIQKRVEEVLHMTHLERFAYRKPKELSGGQQQRVAIARAVVNKPLALLLDEPLSALDYKLRKEMQIELKNLQRQLGITFVFVTHDQEEALSMSDRVVVMNEGVIEQIGTPRQVYENPENLYVAKFIGVANIFEAQVIKATKRKRQFSIDVRIEGTKLKLKTDQPFEKGQHIYIVIRPEDLRAWDSSEIDDTKNMIPARVEEVIYKGSTVDLILKTKEGKQLSATEFFDEDDENLDYRIGEKVWVDWLPGWEVVLIN
ncbi:MAG: spermidine/putrescine ABC transporter ATP-binding protein PotA [Gammaproteobacteria bacterium]|nr:spermidine/putrescine ABC transporter ATP-binding protein PotA [Gammaproteobacteria bacterium]